MTYFTIVLTVLWGIIALVFCVRIFTDKDNTTSSLWFAVSMLYLGQLLEELLV